MTVTIDHDRFALDELPFRWPEMVSSGRFPISGIGAQLVRELARVGWDVPGIDVEVSVNEYGKPPYRYVSRIDGETPEGPFQVLFNREGAYQATVPPGIEVQYYGDDSGPSATLYVGGPWEGEGARRFMRSLNIHERMDGKPRTYLKFSGRRGGGLETLKVEKDNREYGPEPGEPTELKGAEIAALVTACLRGVILRLAAMPAAPGYDDVQPTGDATMRRLTASERIPVPADMPTLYAWVESRDYYPATGRDHRGDAAEAGGVYPISGSGARLALSSSDEKGPLPPRANDGFSFASFSPGKKAGQVVHGARDGSLPVAIRLKALNEIYVVDDKAFRDAREATFAAMEGTGRERATDSELNSWIAATARTMVPYAEYKGDYADPTVVIGRRLGLDEAQPVRGRLAMRTDGEILSTYLVDGEGHEFLLDDQRDFKAGRERAARKLENLAYDLGPSLIKGKVRIQEVSKPAEPEAPAAPAP